MNTFIARQPILNRAGRLVGYELLYRSSLTAAQFDDSDGERATSRVLSSCLFSIGLDRLVGTNLAFINFPKALLVDRTPAVLPTDRLVIEVLETVESDSEVLEACTELKHKGYRIALDDFQLNGSTSALLRLADIVKVDLRVTDEASQRQLLGRGGPQRIQFLAEKVETAVEFKRALRLGYTYFQGYFFARPDLIAGKDGHGFKTHYCQLLAAIRRSPFDYDRLESLIQHDPAFAYKLLRYLNSARFAWCCRITSIRHALLLLGEDEIRRWASLVIAYEVAAYKPHAVLALATVRAQFCDSIGALIGVPDRTNLFLMGLFSLLDAMLDQPLADILSRVPLDDDVAAALLGRGREDSPTAAIYQLVVAYERGDWADVHVHSERLKIPPEALASAYSSAVQWADAAMAA